MATTNAAELPNLRILTNDDAATHRAVLEKAITSANDIWIAVAFLRSSGLDELAPLLKRRLAAGVRLKAFVGLSLYLTEPPALRLLDSICRSGSGQLFVCDPQPSTTFHPKVYCFQGETDGVVVAGSANLTGPGLDTNIEFSLVYQGQRDASTVLDAVSAIERLESFAWTKPADEICISQYERRYEIAKSEREDATKRVSKKVQEIRTFDLEEMHGRVEQYRASAHERKDLETRNSNYRKAKRFLERMRRTTYRSAGQFVGDYGRLVGEAGSGRLWHSDGLQRSKNKVARSYHRFGELVDMIRDNLDAEPARLFDIAMAKKDELGIEGLGVNVLTEIMNTLAPRRFPVLNNNPLGSLEFFGFKEFGKSAGFTPEKYGMYAKLLIDIAVEFGFPDLGAVDHFMNYVYWETKPAT